MDVVTKDMQRIGVAKEDAKDKKKNRFEFLN